MYLWKPVLSDNHPMHLQPFAFPYFAVIFIKNSTFSKLPTLLPPLFSVSNCISSLNNNKKKRKEEEERRRRLSEEIKRVEEKKRRIGEGVEGGRGSVPAPAPAE